MTSRKGDLTMTYHSKRTLCSMASGAILIGSYLIYALGSGAPAPTDLRGWATALLTFIGIGIAVTIAILILFHVAMSISIAVREGEEKMDRVMAADAQEDERDKLICLRAERIGYSCAGVSLLASLVALALGVQPVIALHVLVGGAALASMAEGAASIYLYERGV